jgi:intracellular multiplication protein IcmW
MPEVYNKTTTPNIYRKEKPMPDLSLDGCRRFWSEYQDPIIYRVLTFMESVESWTFDGDPDLEAALMQLGETLEDIGGVDLQREDDLIKIAAYIKATRNLRLLQSLDIAHPGAASKLLMHAEKAAAEEDAAADLFLRRNIIFERLRLLTRVFSTERLALVQKILGE